MSLLLLGGLFTEVMGWHILARVRLPAVGSCAGAACQDCAPRLVEHVPDGGARLVHGRDDGVAQGRQPRHVLHDVQRRKGVQACTYDAGAISSQVWPVLHMVRFS